MILELLCTKYMYIIKKMAYQFKDGIPVPNAPPTTKIYAGESQHKLIMGTLPFRSSPKFASKLLYTTHNLIIIIAMISIGLTAMSLPLRYSITFSVCLRFHLNLQW